MFNAMTSLKPLNTFGLNVHAKHIVYASTPEEISQAWQQSKQQNLPFLLIGAGSNILFIEDYAGIVVANRIKGIELTETSNDWLFHVGGGEGWHQFVEFALQNDIAGLENLALIPGMVGSAPIQNIGAYGVELKDICSYVDLLNLETGQTERLTHQQCQFGYRNSIFKYHYRRGYAIIAVGFKLPKQWKPILSYGNLTQLLGKDITPLQVFEAVCETRRKKLPNPDLIGNAGSFFKNPLITADLAEQLISRYPDIPLYPQASGEVKVAAGWLIEQCQLKGFRYGGAAVHQYQALVLINHDNATAKDIVGLAAMVRDKVGTVFNIWLEPEVRFIASQGEVSAVETIS